VVVVVEDSEVAEGEAMVVMMVAMGEDMVIAEVLEVVEIEEASGEDVEHP